MVWMNVVRLQSAEIRELSDKTRVVRSVQPQYIAPNIQTLDAGNLRDQPSEPSPVFIFRGVIDLRSIFPADDMYQHFLMFS